MGLPEVMDQAALKASAVPGMKGAWGAGVTAGVAGMSMDVPPGAPWAVVYLGPGTAEQGMVTLLDEELEIRVYVPFAALPAAYAILVSMPDLFETAWQTDRDLGGTCAQSTYLGHGKVEREDWGGVPFLFVPIRIGILGIHHVSLTP